MYSEFICVIFKELNKRQVLTSYFHCSKEGGVLNKRGVYWGLNCTLTVGMTTTYGYNES